MAEEGGKQGLPNLASFYIGVVDLFAVLLPGAILGSLLLPCVPLEEFPQYRLIGSPAVQWVAFFVVAYALGHLLFGLGGLIMDPLYGVFYKNGSARLVNRRRVAYRELEKLVGFKPNTGDNALDWTLAILRLREPGSLIELDRLEADSKFMRSVSLTLVLSLPLIQFSRKGYPATFGTFGLVGAALVAQALVEKILDKFKKWDTLLRWLAIFPAAVWLIGVAFILAIHANDGFFLGLGVCSMILAVVTAFRYMDLRQKRTRIAYELLLVLFSPKCQISAAGATAGP